MLAAVDARIERLTGELAAWQDYRAAVQKLEGLGVDPAELAAAKQPRHPTGNSERRVCAASDCGKEFERAGGTRQRFCSITCRQRHNARQRRRGKAPDAPHQNGEASEERPFAA
jgi:hypothetical protein